MQVRLLPALPVDPCVATVCPVPRTIRVPESKDAQDLTSAQNVKGAHDLNDARRTGSPLGFATSILGSAIRV